jgi:hypothetical protein
MVRGQAEAAAGFDRRSPMDLFEGDPGLTPVVRHA